MRFDFTAALVFAAICSVCFAGFFALVGTFALVITYGGGAGLLLFLILIGSVAVGLGGPK